MAGKTEIANRTLIKLGQPRVSNIETDTSPAAITVNNLWSTVRDSLLQSYPWNFAIKRVALAPEGTNPVYGWDRQFLPPVDFLQLLDVKDDIEYLVEGGRILANGVTELYARYIARIEDTSLYPALFNEMLIITLAIEGCDRITQDKNLKTTLLAEQKMIAQRALGADAIENTPEDPPLDDWLRDRL